MIGNKTVLAFIGARSGSKGLANKNIKLFHGKPLMAWTIEAALASSFVDSVIVSTDSKHYAQIAKHYGAIVILRPKELASDDASLMAALVHGYQQAASDYGDFDIVMNLQPTSPLRTAEHINQALELYIDEVKSLPNNNCVRVFSCYQVKEKFAWLMRQDENGNATFINQQEKQKTQHARQNNTKLYLPNGAIFILPSHDLTTFYNEHTIPYLMTESASIDIDSLEDFNNALNYYTQENK